jgi:hypothetical protein
VREDHYTYPPKGTGAKGRPKGPILRGTLRSIHFGGTFPLGGVFNARLEIKAVWILAHFRRGTPLKNCCCRDNYAEDDAGKDQEGRTPPHGFDNQFRQGQNDQSAYSNA